MIPFVSLIRDAEENAEIENEISSVIRGGAYILGRRTEALERSIEAFTSVRNAIGTASGTDSLYLILKRAGAKKVALCASAPLPCAQAVLMAGAEIVVMDCEEDSGLLDIDKFKNDKREADTLLAVHLYGQAERSSELSEICAEKGMLLVEDISQSIGTFESGKHTGSLGSAAALSFYPTKNLGCFGDGGMILTNDDEAARRFRAMRNYGQNGIYSASEFGINSRLDEIQAAVLNIKMKRLAAKNMRRRKIISEYFQRIENRSIILPGKRYFDTTNGHIFPIFSEERDSVREHLKKAGIMTAVHYPVPLHRQIAFHRNESYPQSERLAERQLSLPVFPELTDDEVSSIIRALNEVDFGQ